MTPEYVGRKMSKIQEINAMLEHLLCCIGLITLEDTIVKFPTVQPGGT